MNKIKLNKLKGIKELNRAVTKALEIFDIDNAYLREDFEYRFEKNALGFAITTTEVDEWFNEFIKVTFDYDVTNTFIISILHEIGHAETADFITDKAYEKCLIEKIKISEALLHLDSIETAKALEFKYFALPDEYEATAWAVEYAREHAEELEEMWEEINTALQAFYRLNGLTE